MAMQKTVSRAGYEKLQEEREYLVTVRRKEVAQKLKEARSFGDLSENAEYDEAKNEQAILESKINELELLIANAIVVEDDEISTDEIGVGSIIKIKDLELNEIENLQIVGTTESDPKNGKISDESPIGKAALRKKVGDVFEVEAPAGILKFEVLEISR
ncbi:MAG: transcription elongation factor GreA [Ruminococcus sp.]|jgi:transcription elongation factor GreA|nr:transcription elongation factor GreA [Ruminococcus sp.]MBQ3935472.1 transcription elongation factor GreA [Ruminococcus sp.]MBQ9869852.1 transcription elongation factor GreA [Ruminococcus sp.]MCR5480683.1 transcription elongation factor GreA [Ruminococcus sp.]